MPRRRQDLEHGGDAQECESLTAKSHALSSELQSIKGAQELHDWFGFWPDFHDAEVIRFHLNRSGPSYLAVHTWQMTKRIDSQGFYELEKHVVVEFILDEVSNLSLDGFQQPERHLLTRD
jgi:hypothetical protein